MDLSVGIPTFNRPEKLIKQLYALNASNLSSDDKLKVIVADNSVEYNHFNFKLFTKLEIMYLHNQQNIGLSGNLKKIILSASTNYVWILGDDDKLFPSAINDLKNRLNNIDADLLILCSCTKNDVRIDFINHWQDLIFLSASIFKVSKFASLVESMTLINHTYPQVLLAIVAHASKSKISILKNDYVQDIHNDKSYPPLVAKKVQIEDFIHLESAATVIKSDPKLLISINEKINSHIAAYSVQAMFNYHKRYDMLTYFSKWSWKFGTKKNRNSKLIFVNFLKLIFFINYRIPRVFCLLIFQFMPNKKSINQNSQYFKKKVRRQLGDASTLGYSPD
jgi:glycosyltransferase involved in cell wall biosynthesis